MVGAELTFETLTLSNLVHLPLAKPEGSPPQGKANVKEDSIFGAAQA